VATSRTNEAGLRRLGTAHSNASSWASARPRRPIRWATSGAPLEDGRRSRPARGARSRRSGSGSGIRSRRAGSRRSPGAARERHDDASTRCASPCLVEQLGLLVAERVRKRSPLGPRSPPVPGAAGRAQDSAIDTAHSPAAVLCTGRPEITTAMRSMTGYGPRPVERGEVHATVDVRSVSHRFLRSQAARGRCRPRSRRDRARVRAASNRARRGGGRGPSSVAARRAGRSTRRGVRAPPHAGRAPRPGSRFPADSRAWCSPSPGWSPRACARRRQSAAAALAALERRCPSRRDAGRRRRRAAPRSRGGFDELAALRRDRRAGGPACRISRAPVTERLGGGGAGRRRRGGGAVARCGSPRQIRGARRARRHHRGAGRLTIHLDQARALLGRDRRGRSPAGVPGPGDRPDLNRSAPMRLRRYQHRDRGRQGGAGEEIRNRSQTSSSGAGVARSVTIAL